MCARAHAQMCPLVRISEMAGRIALKFDMWLDILARRFTEVNVGVQVHVHTCAPLFRFSGMAGRIALKFGPWLGDH